MQAPSNDSAHGCHEERQAGCSLSSNLSHKGGTGEWDVESGVNRSAGSDEFFPSSPLGPASTPRAPGVEMQLSPQGQLLTPKECMDDSASTSSSVETVAPPHTAASAARPAHVSEATSVIIPHAPARIPVALAPSLQKGPEASPLPTTAKYKTKHASGSAATAQDPPSGLCEGTRAGRCGLDPQPVLDNLDYAVEHEAASNGVGLHLYTRSTLKPGGVLSVRARCLDAALQFANSSSALFTRCCPFSLCLSLSLSNTHTSLPPPPSIARALFRSLSFPLFYCRLQEVGAKGSRRFAYSV